MTAGIYLDHVLIAVRSLSSAADSYSSLGFKVTPEGRHPGRGTHNRLMVFGPEYLELIAVHDAATTPFRPSMSSFLETREGLYMFALGTSDIDRTVGEIRSRGIDVDVPVPGRRDAGETPGYTWKSANLGSALPGSECFLIQHDHTVAQRYTLPPDPAAHENGVTGVHHVTLAVDDSEAAALAGRRCSVWRPPSRCGGGRREAAHSPRKCSRGSGVAVRPGCACRVPAQLRRRALRAWPGDARHRGGRRVNSARRGKLRRDRRREGGGPSSLIDPSSAAGVRLRLLQI